MQFNERTFKVCLIIQVVLISCWELLGNLLMHSKNPDALLDTLSNQIFLLLKMYRKLIAVCEQHRTDLYTIQEEKLCLI